MAKRADERWWEVRRAQNLKPATYRCPLCGRHLPALSEHMLIVPEGDRSRRRHAHSECVLGARRAGRLLTRDEWRKARQQTEPATEAAPEPGPLRRLRDRLRPPSR
jgi:hypothetical protein